MSNPRASGLGNPTSKILPGSEKQQIYRQDQGNDATVENTSNGDMEFEHKSCLILTRQLETIYEDEDGDEMCF